MPRALPIDRKSQESSIHLRVATIHSVPRRPVTRAPTAKAKGIAALVKPA